jgi:uncharacterized peroxidase-related enzyme
VRLSALEHGQPPIPRVVIRLANVASPPGLDDVAKTSMYRPAFFGREWIALLRSVMRGPSEWSPGERELFAAFVAKLNRCPFCVGVHTGTATLGLGLEIDEARLDAWPEVRFGPRVDAMLAFLERATTNPGDLSTRDASAVLATGVSHAGIRDALHVAYIMNVVNRLANAFDFSYGDEHGRLTSARALHRLGYRLPGFLLR